MFNLNSLFKNNIAKLPFVAFDMFAMPLAWIIVYWLKYASDGIIAHLITKDAITALSILVAGQIACYFKFKVYRGLWHYASLNDVIRVMQATIMSVLISGPLMYSIAIFEVVPRRVLPLYCLVLTALLCGGRLVFRYWAEEKRGYFCKPDSDTRRVFVVGAGYAGAGLVRDLKRTSTYLPLGFIDDDNSKHGLELHGVPIVGTVEQLPDLAHAYQIDLLFIAIPSANSADMRRIVEKCEASNRPFRTLPSLQAFASGQISINALRKVNIDDLLGRDQINLAWDKIGLAIQSRSILVTGAGGSIGSELCRQILRLQPSKLILLDHSEYNLYQAHHDLSQEFPHIQLVTNLVSVSDPIAVNAVFEQEHPSIVFHAAAYKHVPLLQHQLRTAVYNNVIGTQIVAEASVAVGVEKFILISSDKAVNPTNIMGTTKRIAEIYCQNLNNRVSTQFITVRFGNVLGSVGSVIPLFQKQLEAGGPLTVTHPNMERYFMTIPEASQLILQAMANGSGGEIYVLDMGDPIKITYLAEQIIRLAGKIPGKDIHIKFIGLRPGEKLFEELFHESEQLISTEHEKLFKAQFRKVNWDDFMRTMSHIQHACQHHQENVLLSLLQILVPEFKFESIHSIERSPSLENNPISLH